MNKFHYASPSAIGKVMFVGTGTQRLGFGPFEVLVEKKCCMAMSFGGRYIYNSLINQGEEDTAECTLI
jgi:hypothetical protein